eukprot:15235403-Alexandrium_andersonii.AAC.1
MLCAGVGGALPEEDIEDAHASALLDTIAYLGDLGAAVSVPKCYTLANTASLRQRFKRGLVPGCAKPIP